MYGEPWLAEMAARAAGERVCPERRWYVHLDTIDVHLMCDGHGHTLCVMPLHGLPAPALLHANPLIRLVRHIPSHMPTNFKLWIRSPLASDADSENEAIMGGEARELSQSLAFSQLSESDDDQE